MKKLAQLLLLTLTLSFTACTYDKGEPISIVTSDSGEIYTISVPYGDEINMSQNEAKNRAEKRAEEIADGREYKVLYKESDTIIFSPSQGRKFEGPRTPRNLYNSTIRRDGRAKDFQDIEPLGNRVDTSRAYTIQIQIKK